MAPFIIQDETPREERIPRETRHANGITAIGTLAAAGGGELLPEAKTCGARLLVE